MYGGSESERGRLLSRLLDFFSTSRRASQMAGGSYLPADDWCPGHHQSSNLTSSTVCRHPITDCDTLSVCARDAREGKKPHCY